MTQLLAQLASEPTNTPTNEEAAAAAVTNEQLTSQELAEIIVNSENREEIVQRAGALFSSQAIETAGWLQQIETWIIDYSLRTLGALLTFIIGWLLARFISQRVGKWFTKSKRIDDTVANYIQTLTRTAILLITLIAVLGKFGVQTASIVGVISAASLAIGLALQGTLSNFAAGVMLMVFRPFREGEEVQIAGQEGTVSAIGVFATEITAYSGEYVLIPNGEVWGKTIRNLSRNGRRRFEINIELAHSNDHDQAIERIRELMLADDRILDAPAPFIILTELTAAGFIIRARAWTSPTTISSTRSRIIGAIRKEFQVLGVTYPLNEVHVINPANRTDAQETSAP